MKQLPKQRYHNYHKNIKMNRRNEKHPKKDKSKVKISKYNLRYDLLWNRFI